MAQKKSKNKGRKTEGNKPKVVKTVKTVSTSKKTESATKRKIRPTESRSNKRAGSKAVATGNPADMIFGKQNYILMGVGLLLMIVGFMLMSGGEQAADAWQPGEIYSFRRTVLAPFVILAGLVVEIFAIFKK